MLPYGIIGGGSGFGLFISKSIVELHGGTLEVFSAGEGRGCSFCFKIPMTRRSGSQGVEEHESWRVAEADDDHGGLVSNSRSLLRGFHDAGDDSDVIIPPSRCVSRGANRSRHVSPAITMRVPMGVRGQPSPSLQQQQLQQQDISLQVTCLMTQPEHLQLHPLFSNISTILKL